MKKFWFWFVPGVLVGVLLIGTGSVLVRHTSSNEYCNSCHNIHPHSTVSWKQSVHYITKSGNHTDCVECHLPPYGQGYLPAKIRTGARDVWSKWTRDPASFDWEERSRPENAREHVYESSCLYCHENLFPQGLTKEGEDAHIYYTSENKPADLHCINCHLDAGHYIEGYVHSGNTGFAGTLPDNRPAYTVPAVVSEFESFTELRRGCRSSVVVTASTTTADASSSKRHGWVTRHHPERICGKPSLARRSLASALGKTCACMNAGVPRLDNLENIGIGRCPASLIKSP